jgi:hypothetical protein
LTEDNWELAYDQLLCHLIKSGKNDAFGEGDFWLLDDDWGAGGQKICIFNPHVLTKNFISNIQRLLVEKGIESEVLVQIEFDGAPPEGMRITRFAMQEDWDLARLRTIFGNSFYS